MQDFRWQPKRQRGGALGSPDAGRNQVRSMARVLAILLRWLALAIAGLVIRRDAECYKPVSSVALGSFPGPCQSSAIA